MKVLVVSFKGQRFEAAFAEFYFPYVVFTALRCVAMLGVLVKMVLYTQVVCIQACNMFIF